MTVNKPAGLGKRKREDTLKNEEHLAECQGSNTCRTVIPVEDDADDASKAAAMLFAALACSSDDETRVMLLNGAVHECNRLLSLGDQEDCGGLVRTYCEALIELGVCTSNAEMLVLACDVCKECGLDGPLRARASAELAYLSSYAEANDHLEADGETAGADRAEVPHTTAVGGAAAEEEGAYVSALLENGTLADVLSVAHGTTPLTDAAEVRRTACATLARLVQPTYTSGDALAFARWACVSARISCDALLVSLVLGELEGAVIGSESCSDSGSGSDSDSDSESRAQTDQGGIDALWTAGNRVLLAARDLLAAHAVGAGHDVPPETARDIAAIAEYANMSACIYDMRGDACSADRHYATALHLFRAAKAMDGSVSVPEELLALSS